MQALHPSTYASARHVEAHLLDAHRVDVSSSRDGHDALLRYHLELHRTSPARGLEHEHDAVRAPAPVEPALPSTAEPVVLCLEFVSGPAAALNDLLEHLTGNDRDAVLAAERALRAVTGAPIEVQVGEALAFAEREFGRARRPAASR